MKQGGKSFDYKILGIVLSAVSLIFVLLANGIDRKENIAIIIVSFLAIFSMIGAVLSFMKAKNEKKSMLRQGNPVILSEQSENNEFDSIKIKTDHIPAYPVYPNQDTDIPADSYVFDENGQCLGRSDGKPLNDADAAYLIREGARKAIEAEAQSDNPKFHRSPAEKELCFRFFDKHGAESDQLCDVFQELAAKAYTVETADEKLALLQQSADAFYKAREWHYHCSKGGMMWFQDMWEHCHNSQSECFCWVDHILKAIQETQKEIALIEPWILDQAQAGFLQTDIYKAFPDDNKTMLGNVISRLVNQGKIQKQKKGSSYFIQTVVPEENDLV